MGYTHYWKGRADLNATLSLELNNLVTHGYVNHVIQKEQNKEEIPEVVTQENKEIYFNGIGDEGHETFVVEFGKSKDFDFCKTARKDYDAYVVASLILIQEANPNSFSWSSDGCEEEGEFDEGKNLADQFRLPRDKALEDFKDVKSLEVQANLIE